MNEAKIREVFSDKEFVLELINIEDVEEIKAALAEKELDYTTEQICTMKEMVKLALEKAEAGEELTEEQLNEIAGGNPLAFIPIFLLITCLGAFGASTATRGRW